MALYRPPATLLRRSGALIYDAVLLVAVLIAAALPVVLLYGEAIEGEPWFTLYLLAVGYLYFAWFWVHGGQTLGMKTWRLLLIRDDGADPGWKDTLIRYVAALISWVPAAGGFLWSLVDRERRTLHDIVSGTSIVVLPPRRRSDDAAQGDDAGAGE